MRLTARAMRYVWRSNGQAMTVDDCSVGRDRLMLSEIERNRASSYWNLRDTPSS